MMPHFWILIVAAVFGILNRARGTRLFNLTDSTVEGRIISTGFMACMIALPYSRDASLSLHMLLWTWASLMVWATPAWDALWSAAIGNDPNHSRGWGTDHLAWRMGLAAPAVIGVAYISGHTENCFLALGTLFLAIPYYVFGHITPGKNVIRNSEFAAGALLGSLLYLSTTTL